MLDRDLAFLPAWKLGVLIAGKEISPVELSELYLRRIDALDNKLNSYLSVTSDLALSQARTSEARIMRGARIRPLEGIPISIKDLMFVKNEITTSGSLIFSDYVPDHDSIVVEKIKKSGAVILGKTNTPEFGLAGTTHNRLGDECRNPWDIERTSGGSSGGAAAAVAAGLCSLALGSDGGGSIRIPASFCGIFGIKPSRGRVARYGGFGGWPLFSTIGPLTRSVQDSATLLQVISGRDPRDATSLRRRSNFLTPLKKRLGSIKVAWSPNLGYAAVDSDVVNVTRKAVDSLMELGICVDEPNIAMEDPFQHFWNIATVDSYVALGSLHKEHNSKLTEYAREFIGNGMTVDGIEYARSFHALLNLQAYMEGIFTKFDILITPVAAVPPFRVGQAPSVISEKNVTPAWGFFPFTYPFNMTGQPAASVPCGFSSDGLPIGLQIIGRSEDESTVLRVCAAFEEILPWSTKRPTVS